MPGLRNSDRKSTRLNSSHLVISYAVFCLKKKKQHNTTVLTANAGAETPPDGGSTPGVAVVKAAGAGGNSRAGVRSRGFSELFFFLMKGKPPSFPLFPPTTLRG